MKPILSGFIFLLLFIPCFAQDNETKRFSPADLELTVSDVKKSKETLEIEITLKNKSRESIFIFSPIVADDFKTSYFLGSDEPSKTLQIRRHFFLPLNNVLHAPVPCYALYIIESGKSIREKFVLGYPLIVNSYFFGFEIDISKYDKFNARIGVLPFDVAIDNIRNNRPFGQRVHPQDKIEGGIYKGKTLIEIQEILSADAN